ncbi:GNAT family N-acetyltransferase [Evansella sp. AB-P1]|uniref:GNAT family N-acetyltransferase n=1 Tax=Evansella sp. AB-P1 TaxID=3037653 RepID=UPI0024203282|nr:GNAT family N-acetyltransferase [Evansella sp. AB-P1]MDG5789520.1 GNAT family N-acetyltransferase [Evansella sp. AB-P1]
MEVKVVTTEEELRDAHAVRRVVFIEEQQVPEEIELDEHEGEATHFVVYDEDQLPIGAGRLRLFDDYGKAERVCVLKEHRGLGVGERLMEAIEGKTKDAGLGLVKLNAQTHAEAFYKRIGYETVSDVFYDAGIAHVAMRKEV